MPDFEKKNSFQQTCLKQISHWYMAMICFPWMSGMVKYSNETKDKSNYCSFDSKYNEMQPDFTQEEALEHIREFAPIKRDGEDPVGETFERWRCNRYSAFKALGIQALPCVLIFDSLPANKRTVALKIVRNFLKLEWDCRRSQLDGELKFDKDTVRGFSPRVPAQSNLADCGIYLLHYVEMFFQNPLTTYTREYFQSSMTNWFKSDKVSEKRQEIKSLILKIYERENNDN
ncbi:Sentrin-specific protease 6 [Cichlidogyrus casuarinus]|uniref:Sentrin-specific protease 6 n=1 Tax=Cichlidogyrus casuarinus TaxID=1844966 RepID=A0ABD2Q1L5_9PLAT